MALRTGFDRDRLFSSICPGGPTNARPLKGVTMEEYTRLRELVDACADDVAKASGGNKAAGTRVRKAMQDIKEAAPEVRKRILEGRSSESPTGQPH